MGASPWQIIFKFIIPEARSSLILNLDNGGPLALIGATAMAGAVGAGGIGDLAISYGYQRFDTSVVIFTVIVLLILVPVLQSLGDWLSKIVSRQPLHLKTLFGGFNFMILFYSFRIYVKLKKYHSPLT